MSKITIRQGIKNDLPGVFELVKELAEFERAADQVTNTIRQMEIDGFGATPVFGFLVAEDATGIHGLSLYYYRYSTWKGKRLYLEDIIVTASRRGAGIGKMLFAETMKKSVEEGCTGLMWQVLEWNEPAIKFYQSYGATLDAEWTNCSLEKDRIETLLRR